MPNDINIDIDTAEYNRRMDMLDAELLRRELEQQQRDIQAMMERMEPPKTFHMNVAFPTSYIETADGVAPSQRLVLGDPTSLFTLLNDHGIHVMQYPPSKNPKVTSIIIGGEWSEASVEWELE